MSTQPQNPEAGARRNRLGFIREAEYGVTPADPDYLKYSDSFTDWTWTSGATNEAIPTAGDVNPVGFEKGPEDHDMEVTYPLLKWFVDGSSNPLDAAYDGLVRDADNLLPNSHTVVDRVDRDAISADATVAGNTARPSRLYVVGRGGLIDEADITGDPSSTPPTMIDLSYKFQKVRPFQIDQPTSSEGSTLITASSSDAADTSQTLTIEDEGANTSVSLTLNGTTLVTDATSFDNIDAVELSEECVGDVTVYINSGDQSTPTQGDELCVIRGSDSYDGVEGDLGVPALGAGSREDTSSLTGGYEKFIGDVIQRGANPYPHEIPSASITVSNNVDSEVRSSGYGQAYFPGDREVQFEATVYGEAVTYDLLDYHLRNEQLDHSWEMTGGTLTVVNASLTDPADDEVSEGNAVATRDNTFTGTDLTIT